MCLSFPLWPHRLPYCPLHPLIQLDLCIPCANSSSPMVAHYLHCLDTKKTLVPIASSSTEVTHHNDKMSEKDPSEGTQPKQQQTQQPLDQAVIDLALQQVQMGLNVFWLIQQASAAHQQQPAAEQGSSSASFSDQQHSSLFSAFSNVLATGKIPPICSSILPTAQPEEKRRRDLSIIGRRWEYVSDVQSFAEFEQLRCRHQVSRNRTFAHGIRYSCTQKTQLRSNCPYLLLCLFSDGAGEHSAPGVGTISVYSRNKHTHPVKVIKARQPRRFAKLAKKERKENGGGDGRDSNIAQQAIETVEKGQSENEDEAKTEGTESDEVLLEVLSKMLAEQQQNDEVTKNE